MTNLLAPHVGPGQDGLVLPEPPDHLIIKKGLSCWKQFYASLDKSVLQGMLLKD